MTEFITTHVENAVEKLFWQYQDSKNIVGILESIAESVQDVENNQYTLYFRWYIELMEGDNLDIIGDQVGLPRDGLNDSDYRVRLRTKIFINSSNGGLEDMYAFIRRMAAGRQGSVRIADNYPAGFQIITDVQFTDTEFIFIKESINMIKGIAIGFTSFTAAPENAFRFDIGAGFSSVDEPTVGGKLAKVI